MKPPEAAGRAEMNRRQTRGKVPQIAVRRSRREVEAVEGLNLPGRLGVVGCLAISPGRRGQASPGPPDYNDTAFARPAKQRPPRPPRPRPPNQLQHDRPEGEGVVAPWQRKASEEVRP